MAVPLLLIRPGQDGEEELRIASQSRSIVIPIDGSEASESAIELAQSVFGGVDQSVVLHLIHVIRTPTEFLPPYLAETIEQTASSLEPRRV